MGIIRPSPILRIVLPLILAFSLLYFLTKPEPSTQSLVGKGPRKGTLRRPKFTKKPKPLAPSPAMAEAFLQAIEARRSIYAISDASPPVSDARIEEIVALALKHAPSAFNSQAGRAVVLLKDEHKKLWDLGHKAAERNLPSEAYKNLKSKIDGLKAGYGSVLVFEDQDVVNVMKKKNPSYPFDQWSEHSSGMLQNYVWTTLSLEGFGANLQHYNFMKGFAENVTETWDLPESWDLKAQVVFGTPTGGPRVKEFAPLEPRLKVFGK